ncbi:MAG: RluA family pseudouridine synthase [Flavobacteriaceae bacterium]|nr:RluA family pseudouridine synthase [Flavobacteriaceae bacterium]
MSKLEIIFENNDFLVVNKTAGHISERSRYESSTVESLAWEHVSKQKKKPYLGMVHRLDRVTSGVIVLAKKKSVLVGFQELFSKRKVQKTYVAIVSNKPAKTHGRLQHFLEKNQKEKKSFIVPTKTKNAVVASLSYRLIGENQFGYILEVRPKTGRYHQIRAQLAHIGLPIIGDEKYGSYQKYKDNAICLHAWKLECTPPNKDLHEQFEAPLPKHAFWLF